MKYFLTILFLFSLGCNGFNHSGSASINKSPAPLSDVDYQLSIQTGPYEGRLVVDQIRKSLIKVLIPIGTNATVPIGNFNSAQWSISGTVTQDGNGFKTLEANVPVSYIVQGVSSPLISTLPNGDALDFLASGEAQHFSFPLNDTATVNLHLYFSPPYLLGVFIQTPFDLASSNKYAVTEVGGFIPSGFFSTHPHRPPLNGGALVFISLPQ